ncbi:MAG: 23S rRNA (guanosine2251-2'-O)-methyltransferase, partial [Cellvibrionaceae bacterium]
EVIGLSSRGEISLADYLEPDLVIYVLGNETRGISDLVAKQCNRKLKIDMNRGVESLNVAVTAGIIAFRSAL